MPSLHTYTQTHTYTHTYTRTHTHKGTNPYTSGVLDEEKYTRARWKERNIDRKNKPEK